MRIFSFKFLGNLILLALVGFIIYKVVEHPPSSLFASLDNCKNWNVLYSKDWLKIKTCVDDQPPPKKFIIEKTTND